MSRNFDEASNQLAEFIQSSVELDAVDLMTQKLNADLADSQKVMNEIQAIFNCIPNSLSSHLVQSGNGRSHEDISTILDAAAPTLLMPDMVDSTADIDLDDVIATMKSYVDNIKKTVLVQPTTGKIERKEINSLDLVQYAQSLGQLNKRLANLKLGKRHEANARNMELEAKLAILCQDVNMFTQMVETKKTLSEGNNEAPQPLDNNGMQYDEIITKLLSGLNEITYLLHNKN